ncbi:MAG: hypothetical protein ACI9LX_004681 [Paraglaciecola sp.]|jgi:hypothetical protein
MVVDTASIAQDYPSMTWYQPHIKDMWRFGPLLPFDINTDLDSVCTLGEGYTPIIDISHYPEIRLLTRYYFKYTSAISSYIYIPISALHNIANAAYSRK